MKKRVVISVLICIAVLLATVICVHAASQTRLLSVNVVFDGRVSVYVDGVYLADAPLSRYVDKDSKITLVSDSDGFMFYSDTDGNTFGYDGEYSFNIIANTTVDAWYENTDTDRVCIIYKNVNDSRQLLASASYKLYEIDGAFTDHLVDSANKFGYDFVSWNKSVAEIIASADNGDGTVIVEPVFAEQGTLFTLNVVGGAIVSENGGNGVFPMHSSVILKANEAEQGMKFAYWTNSAGRIISDSPAISITVISNETYTAHFVEENDTVDLIPSVSLAAAYDSNVGKIVTVAQRFLPEDYTIKGYGLIYAKDALYAEKDMTCDMADGVLLKMSYNSSPQSTNGIWINRISCDSYVCVRAYVIYEDANGETYTAYSNSVKASVESVKIPIIELDFNDGFTSAEGCNIFGSATNENNALALSPGHLSALISNDLYSVINIESDFSFAELPTDQTELISLFANVSADSSGDGLNVGWDDADTAKDYGGEFLVLGADGYLYVYSAAEKGYLNTSFRIETNTVYKISASYNIYNGIISVSVNGRVVASSSCGSLSGETLVVWLMDDTGAYTVTLDNISVSAE